MRLQMVDHLEAEVVKAVAVGHDQTLDASEDDRIEDSQEMLAPEIETAADFLYPFVYGPSIRRTELLQHVDLVVEVRLLRPRRHACIDDGNPPVEPGRPAHEGQVLIAIQSPIARRALWLETAPASTRNRLTERTAALLASFSGWGRCA